MGIFDLFRRPPAIRDARALADFIDETSMDNSYDWWAMSRQAKDLRRERVEDYVSAAAAVDGPLVPEDLDTPDEPR